VDRRGSWDRSFRRTFFIEDLAVPHSRQSRAIARAVEHQRRLPREPSVDPARFDASGQWAEPVESWDDAVAERMDASALTTVLRAALNELPPRQREIVLLRDVEGLSSEEACDVLEIRPGTQRILLHRGRAGLREILANEMKKA
jgi:RNA polymerase sigma-70 factor, ECF subfamily